MFSSASMCDVTLAAADGYILAHKAVLAASSSFFRDLLSLHHGQSGSHTIYLRGVSKVQLMKILEYMYEGETKVFEKDIVTFLELAKGLKLKGLSEHTTENQTPCNQSTNLEVHSDEIKEESKKEDVDATDQ